MIHFENLNYTIMIILIQVLFVTMIDAAYWPHDNATDSYPTERSDRWKRAPFHRYIPSIILRATIKDGDKDIHLTWRRVERYVFNQNLPVYTAHMNSWGPTHKKSQIMRDIGNTITYHDIEHKSTVIYFENTDALYGIVGRTYEITGVRIDALSKPLLVGGEYVAKLPYHPHRKKKLKRPASPRHPDFNGKRRKLDSGEASTSSVETRRDSVPEPFYIETLLLVTYDVFSLFREMVGEELLGPLINAYLLHYNAVDMVFAMLPTNEFEIYINLAGIIVEAEDGVFSKIVNYSPLKYDNQKQLRVDEDVFQNLALYSNHEDFPFPKDSFDFMLVSTGRALHLNQDESPDKAWHLKIEDIFFARQHYSSRSIVPTAIVRSRDPYDSFCVVAHTIGEILGIEADDPTDKDITEEGIQCYGIMQSSMHHCSECMKWSDESINQLKVFLSENRNRCWLLNKPRSLLPYGTPIISLSPCRQCSCFGYTSYGEEKLNECPWFISNDGCGNPLQCRRKHFNGKMESEPSILPFDGTPCGHKKVCWGEVCTSL